MGLFKTNSPKGSDRAVIIDIPRFNEAKEARFSKFLRTETKRIFDLKLPENVGKSIDEIKSDVFNMHYPRWEQE